MTELYYFAYGSNLDRKRLEERIGFRPDAIQARLRDYRFAFNKGGSNGEIYANVVPETGSDVWGVAYRCSEADMKKLDSKEGVAGGHYHRKEVDVETPEGQKLTATLYIAGDEYIVEEGKPSRRYLQYILDGAKEHGLPIEYIQRIEQLAS